jgi:hypothetical protein
MGIEKPRLDLQKNDLDNRTRNKIWNCYYRYYIEEINVGMWIDALPSQYQQYIQDLWDEVLSRPLNHIPSLGSEVCQKIEKIYREMKWNEIYDLIEFTVNVFSKSEVNKGFTKAFNEIMESEKTAYRLSGKLIVPLTNEEELKSLDEAIAIPIAPSIEHLHKAIKLFSDRDSPDYANSIKESISAVESMCRIIGKNEHTLGDGIKRIAPQLGISIILRDSLSKLYGYTCVEPGARHGAKEQIKADFDDAKFFLVTCSGWMNYLYGKAIKAGIDLEPQKARGSSG